MLTTDPDGVMGRVAEDIERKLRAAFRPERLVIIDESHRHAGHSGWRESGETHFRVEITSAAFRNLSRIERQRAVYAVLEHELGAGIHALALSLEAPGSS